MVERYTDQQLLDAGFNPALLPIIRRESGGKNVGWEGLPGSHDYSPAGTDLSGYPLKSTGFPAWPGKMGPEGNSTAAGVAQIVGSTWDPIAAKLGVTDFSLKSQARVANELYRQSGTSPWRASEPGYRRGGGGGGGTPEGYYEGAQHVTVRPHGDLDLSVGGALLLSNILKQSQQAEEPSGTGNALLDGILKAAATPQQEAAPPQQQQQPPQPAPVAPPPLPTVAPELQLGQPVPQMPAPQQTQPSGTPMPGQASVPAQRPPGVPDDRMQQASMPTGEIGDHIYRAQPTEPPPPFNETTRPPPPGGVPMPQVEPEPPDDRMQQAGGTGNSLLNSILKQVSPISTAQAAEPEAPPATPPAVETPSQPEAPFGPVSGRELAEPPAQGQSLTAGSRFPLTPTGNALLDGIMQTYRQDTGDGVRDVPPLETYLQKPREPYGQHYFERPADQLPALIADPGAAETDVEIERGHTPYYYKSPFERIQEPLTKLGEAVTPYVAGFAPGTSLSSGLRGRGGAPPRIEPPPIGARPPTSPGVPSVMPGTTRLYRGIGGGTAGTGSAEGGWFTTDPAKAALYGKVHYVDVTRDDLKSFAQGHGGPDEFITDNKGIIGRAQPLEGGAGGKPPSGGAGPPPPPEGPPSATPPPGGGAPPPPGVPPLTPMRRVLNQFVDWARQAKREVQIFATPMATGRDADIAIAKDFANAERLARDHRMQFDKLLRNFNPQQWREMWDAMDNASVAAQATGDAATGMRYLDMLEPAQRDALLALERFGVDLWERARAAGVVAEDAERLPFYVMRGVIHIGEDGGVAPLSHGAPGPRNITPLGTNVRTRGAFQREHLTTEETEAAAQARFGPGASVVRNIRMLPLAYERLEKAIAGRNLINSIRDMEPVVGKPLVSDTPERGFFTIDHPAFKTYRVVGRRADGQPIVVGTPLYVSREMEGPLRGVLRTEPGALYRGAMAVKGGTMSLIMNSPLIHNMVEWGRSLPAMPGKVATGRIYFIGNRASKDPVLRERAIGQDGLVPIGRGYEQDITGIAQGDPLDHRGMLSTGVSAVSERGAQAIDRAGRFWHETLLWDRVRDLQFGLYSEMRQSLINKGWHPSTAGKMAAHFANRYAGALPNEAMSEWAKKISNLVMFSRTFTFGNLGILKDAINGLPRDVRVMIERELGPLERRAAVSYARRKAIGVVMTDVAIAYAMNSILQNGIDYLFHDKSLSDIEHEYADRFQRLLNRGKEHPLEVLNPLTDIASLLPGADHEPGKENRIELWRQPDGTAVYGRVPVGKVGEEFVGWLTSPMQTFKNKEGTLFRPLQALLNNDRGFGQRIYDPNRSALDYRNIGAVVWELLRTQLPEGQFQGAIDAIHGKGGALPYAQMGAPFFGGTVSRGAPGGPQRGVEFQARQRAEGELKDALPTVRDLVQQGKIDEAVAQLQKLGVSPREAKSIIGGYMNPAGAIQRGEGAFRRRATPEELERFEHVR